MALASPLSSRLRSVQQRIEATGRDPAGITIVAVEHVMKAIVSISDRIVVLHHGSILTSGTPDQVLSDPRVIEAYLGHRFARRRAT